MYNELLEYARMNTTIEKYRGNGGGYRVSSVTELRVVRDLETDKRSFEWTECVGIRNFFFFLNSRKGSIILLWQTHIFDEQCM